MGFRSTGSYEPDPFAQIVRMCIQRSFDPQALTSLTSNSVNFRMPVKSFDPQALTSLTQEAARDAERRYGFDPQALTSLTLYLGKVDTYGRRFDPQALTSLTLHLSCTYYTLQQFRSTGSYEPDQITTDDIDFNIQFRSTGSYEPDHATDTADSTISVVSIHRLLRA